jgi:dihydrofolate reductase
MKCSVFVGTSLDGFIAREDGAFDFLPTDGGEPHGYPEFFASVDALVIGRKTYETALAFPTWPYETKPVFVLSATRLLPPDGAVVERRRSEPAEIVAALAARGIRHVRGRRDTIHQFIAKVVQRIVVTRVRADQKASHCSAPCRATSGFGTWIAERNYEIEGG